jgi:hypothetical protein
VPDGTQATVTGAAPAPAGARPATVIAVTAIVIPMADRTFAKFTFFKIDPEWRRRDTDLRATDKREFLAACGTSRSTARCVRTQP